MKKDTDAGKVLSSEKLNEEKVFERYISYHTDRYSQFGNNSKAVWNREESQRMRFHVLSKLFRSKQDFSVLDIGCGLADFFSYLHQEGYKNIDYTGFDINKIFISEAKKKHPAANLFCGSYNEIFALNKKFDYAIGCGIHAFGENQESVHQYFIDKFTGLFPILSVGFGVNFLSVYSKNPDSISVYHDPSKVFHLVKQRFDKASLFHNYLPNDFTILVEK